MDHYVDHFEMSQETLLKYSDEVCEAIHSQYRIFEERHGYKKKKKKKKTIRKQREPQENAKKEHG